MKPEDQVRVIAEHCPSLNECCRCQEEVPAEVFRYGAFFCCEECASKAGDMTLELGQKLVPNYLGSLDAIHAAIMESILNGRDLEEWRSNEDLFQIQLDLISEREQVPVWHFGPELLAEALIKTYGEWKS